jgi:phage tail sheath protein FI
VVSVSWPGVYVEEFTPAPPIQGVSTSTVAFLGPTHTGPILEPKLVTSWDEFQQIFGNDPTKLPGFYLWYAVRGFFENGGRLAYIVRISNAHAARLALDDRASASVPTAEVVAKTPGAAGNSIQVQVTETQALNNVTAFKHNPAITGVSGTEITFGSADDAAKFRPGDLVSIQSDPAPAPRAAILRINGDTVTLSQPLASAAIGQNLRLADLQTADGDKVIRFFVNAPDDPANLVPGTILVLDNTVNSETAIVQSAVREFITLAGPPLVTYRVTLRAGVANDYGLAPGDPALDATSREFDLRVQDGAHIENYQFLSIDPLSPRYYGVLVNASPQSERVTLRPAQPPDPNLPPDNLPRTVPVPPALPPNLAGGADENLGSLLLSDYQDGLEAIRNLDVNIVAVPDRQDTAVQDAIIAHCEGVPPKAGDRFAILDSQLGAPITGAGSVADHIATITGNGNGFAALYYPWVLVPPAPPPSGSPPPAVAPPNILIPPSGHVAGVYARIDNSRGVHKAPAGLEANLNGTIGVERVLGDTEQGLLNLAPYGINVIRVFRGGQPLVWGGRTNAVAAGNTNWQYVNIRRLFLFLEGSITAGIRFAVFEPNNLELWGKLKRSIGAFLTKVWQDGALFGATAKDAFYVRIDEALNPPDQLALGYLTIVIGVRPSYPAEFIVVRIGIWPGGSSVTEVV